MSTAIPILSVESRYLSYCAFCLQRDLTPWTFERWLLVVEDIA